MMNTLKLCFFILITCFHASPFAQIKFAVNGLNDSASNNVALFLTGLHEPDNADNKTYLKQVEESAREALTALGYYQVEMQLSVSGIAKKQTVLLAIQPGVVTRIKKLNIRITGEGKKDPAFTALLDNFAVKLNDALHHGNYEAAKKSLNRLAQRRGYFDAKYDKSTVEVTSKNNSALVYLWFDTGVRYQFGKLIFSTANPAEKYVRSLKNFTTGAPFDAQILNQFNLDINKTAYFSNITLLPEIQNKQGLRVPINVIANMRPQDSFNVGLGYSTDQGVRGKFRWLRPWVNNYGHSIEGNIVASIPKQEASLIYKIPLEDPVYNYVSLQTGYKTVNQNDTDTNQYLLSLSRHWRLSNQWLRSLFIKYDYEYGMQGQQEFSTALVIPGISFRNTRIRGGVNAYWGDNKLISLEASNGWWLSDENLLKVYGRSKWLRSYHEQQFVTHIELGAIYADAIASVPSSMRFFTGGDQSIRGYQYESIAPIDEQGYLAGGRYLAVASLEYRFPVSQNWKIALFTDAGTATNDFSENIAQGAGVGAVWASPVGPIRMYLAKPFTGETSSLSLHFMIGPEL